MHKPTTIAILILLSCLQVYSNSTADPLSTPINEVSPFTSSVPTTSAEDIRGVLAFGDQVIYIVSSKLASLPDDMVPIGERILLDIKATVHNCEYDLRRNGLIGEYKVCCSSQLRYGLNALAGLSHGNAESGASRAGLFCM